MSPTVVRRLVIAVCVAGIAGMIASSIADNTGAALTAGLITAIAVLCLIVATAVSGPKGVGITDLLATDVEDRVEALVADGADEADVRALVSAAVKLGKAQP